MKYEVKIRTLTPLHIGTGNILLRDYDYVTTEDRTLVLNQEAILTQEYERTGRVPDRPAGRFVAPADLKDGSPLVRYSLAGATSVGQIQEQIKDVQGQCYLPGSSIKGALRTVLMAHALRSRAFVPDLDTLAGAKSWAAQPWERAIFGQKPNSDLLRALQVADTQPLVQSAQRLTLLNAQVFSGGVPSAPVWVEAIPHGQSFQTVIRVDDWLLQEQAGRFGWKDKSRWLTDLPALGQAWAVERLNKERAFAEEKRMENPAKACAQLLKYRLASNQFMLQVGWGTGWSGITVGTLLSLSDQRRVRERYGLGRPPRARGEVRLDPNKPFPNSRRLHVARGTGASAEPGVPLGWVVVEMNSKG